MHDWDEVVRSRLGTLGVSRARAEEISEELAAHLCDREEDLIRQGLTPEESARRVKAEVHDWNEARNAISRALAEEDTMRDRIRRIWIPGLAATILSMLWFDLEGRLFLHGHVAWLGIRPVWLSSGASLTFFWPWLFILPVLGALAAAWSKRTGGTRKERALAALLPASTFPILFITVFLIGVFLQHGMSSGAFIGVLIFYSAIPALALFVGALPFLRNNSERVSAQA